MKVSRCGLAIIAACFATARAGAQENGVFVQLPTFSFFTVQTTISVPDSGGAFSGGERRVSSGWTAFGPAMGPPQRGRGAAAAAGGVHVAAQVHDLEGSVAGAPASSTEPGDRFAHRLAAAAGSSAGQPPPGSLADAERQRTAEAESLRQQALSYAQRARRALAAGKPGAARIYYQMALRRAPDDLQAEIAAELESIPRAKGSGPPAR